LSARPRLLLQYACACTCLWGTPCSLCFPRACGDVTPEGTTSFCTHFSRLVM
jgi:hypothetical protein